MKQKWYVYILRCRDNSLYVGITTDITKRLSKHNSKRGAKYTRSHCPVELVYQESHPTKSRALKREHEIKSWTKAAKESFIISHSSCRSTRRKPSLSRDSGGK